MKYILFSINNKIVHLNHQLVRDSLGTKNCHLLYVLECSKTGEEPKVTSPIGMGLQTCRK